MLRMNELNMRAARAEQRVLELEQLLREHAVGGAHDDTCDDSEILTPLPQHVCLEVRWICFLIKKFKLFPFPNLYMHHLSKLTIFVKT